MFILFSVGLLNMSFGMNGEQYNSCSGCLEANRATIVIVGKDI